MATHEYLSISCDKCRSVGDWWCINHHELQRMAVRAGWYRDAWTDLCPRCAAAVEVPDALQLPNHKPTDGTEHQPGNDTDNDDPPLNT